MAGIRMVAVEMEKSEWNQDIIWRLYHQHVLIDWVWFMRKERNEA